VLLALPLLALAGVLAAAPTQASDTGVTLTLTRAGAPTSAGGPKQTFDASYSIDARQTTACPGSTTPVEFWWDGYPGGPDGPADVQKIGDGNGVGDGACSSNNSGPLTHPPGVTCGPHQVFAFVVGAGYGGGPLPGTIGGPATYDLPPCPRPHPTMAPSIPGVIDLSPAPEVSAAASPSHSPSPSASAEASPSPSPSASPQEGVAGLTTGSPPPDDTGVGGPLAPLVNQGGPQRSLFAASLLGPPDVSTAGVTLGINLVLALVAVLLIAFPSELFNSTLEENYEEVRGWFGPVGRVGGSVAGLFRRVPGWIGAIPFILVMAALYGLLDPGFGLTGSSLALYAGLVAGLLVITVVFDLPGIIHVRLKHGHTAALRTLPWSLAVAALCVLVSRLAHFQPGYLYGLVAGLAVQGELSQRQHGKSLAIAAAGMFAVSLVAWFAWLPVRALASQPGAPWWALAADAALAVTFVCGLETMIFGLLPMRFLDGHKIYAWSRPVWAVLFGLGLFGLIQVLLTPRSGYVGRSIGGNELIIGGLLLGFALASIAFWSYFRFRPARGDPETAKA
jgi:hypothetical protein